VNPTAVLEHCERRAVMGDSRFVPLPDENRAVVVSVSRDSDHRFSKRPVDEIILIAGWGIEGDAHAGTTVQHLSRVACDPSQPNLRQVHLIHAELFDEVAAAGYEVAPGQLGENITTRHLDLFALPEGTILRIGDDAVVRVTGLRNPCQQINGFEPGLLSQVLGRADDGSVERKGGVMTVVVVGGVVRVNQEIRVQLSAGEWRVAHGERHESRWCGTLLRPLLVRWAAGWNVGTGPLSPQSLCLVRS
jgi:MOSC domain-containing protein YiiM